MTAWAITVDHDELDRVAALLGPCPPCETDHNGVWVEHRTGTRFWSCVSFNVQWELEGAYTGSDLPGRCLPGRLVWHAAEFASRTAEEVSISVVDDRYGLLESPAGSAVIDLPDTSDPPAIPSFVEFAATAVTTVAELHNLISRTLLAPIGFSDQRPEWIDLFMVDGELATTIDWGEHGGLRSTYRIPASGTGEASGVVPASECMDLLRNLESEREISVSFPEEPYLPMLISADDLQACVARRVSGAKRFHAELGQTLADASGQACRSLDNGVLSAQFAARTVRVELADLGVETIHVTTGVCWDVEPKVDVLTQLNELNRGLVGTKLWIDDNGVVVAGFDVPCTALRDVGDLIAELNRQVEGLDVFLAALGEAA